MVIRCYQLDGDEGLRELSVHQMTPQKRSYSILYTNCDKIGHFIKNAIDVVMVVLQLSYIYKLSLIFTKQNYHGYVASTSSVCYPLPFEPNAMTFPCVKNETTVRGRLCDCESGDIYINWASFSATMKPM